MKKPKIAWSKLAANVRLYLRDDLEGASVRDGAKSIGIDKSALQRVLSGKPVSAANYAQLCWQLCDRVEKYLRA